MSELIFFVCLVTMTWLATRSLLPMSINVFWQQFGGAILVKLKLNQPRDRRNFFYIPPSGIEALWFKPKARSVVLMVMVSLVIGVAASHNMVLRGSAALIALLSIFASIWFIRTTYLLVRVSWLTKGDKWSIAEYLVYQLFTLIDGIVVGLVTATFLPDVGVV